MSNKSLKVFLYTGAFFWVISVMMLDGGFSFVILAVVFIYTLLIHVVAKIPRLSEVAVGLINGVLYASLPVVIQLLFHVLK